MILLRAESFLLKIKGSIDHSAAAVIKNSSIVLVGGGLNTAVNLMQTAVIVRYLGVEQYGYLALLQGLIALIFQFIDFRTWEVVSKFLPTCLLSKSQGKITGLVAFLVIVDLIAGLFGILVLFFIAPFLNLYVIHNESLLPMLNLYALSLPASLIISGTCVGVLRILDKFFVVNLKNLFLALFGFGLISIQAILSILTLKSLIVTLLFIEVIHALATIIITIKHLRPIFVTTFVVNVFEEIQIAYIETKSFLFQTWLSGTIKGIQMRMDIPLIGLISSPVAVGNYKLLLEISSSLSKIGNPFQNSVLPVFIELVNSKKEAELRRNLIFVTKLLAAILIPIIILSSVFSKGIIGLFGGGRVNGSALGLSLLMLGVGINTILVWSRPLLVARGRLKEGNVITIIGSVLEILFILLLTPSQLLVGPSFAVAAMYIFTSCASVFVAIKPSNK